MNKTVYGTAREASEMSAFSDLCDEYDVPTANKLIQRQLAACGVSIDEFTSYLTVKGKIQHGCLDVRAAKEHAESQVRQLVDSALGNSSGGNRQGQDAKSPTRKLVDHKIV